MNVKKRQKLCQTCEGEVDFDVIFCPFCGTDLLEEQDTPEETVASSDSFRTLSNQESIASLYPPPYQPEANASMEEEVLTEEEEQKERRKIKNPALPALFLSVGAWFFLLGVLLFIFSENGIVTLRFDAKMWLIYLLISAPLLFAGSKFLPSE